MTRSHPMLTKRQAEALVVDTEPWLSCESCFHLMDRYVEAERAGGSPDPAMRTAMQHHLRACAARAEEAESLRQLLESDDGTQED